MFAFLGLGTQEIMLLLVIGALIVLPAVALAVILPVLLRRRTEGNKPVKNAP